MIRAQIYFPEDLYRDIKLFSQTNEIKVSSIVRQATKDFITKKTKTSTKGNWKNFIGAYKGKVKTNAVKVFDEYYRNGCI